MNSNYTALRLILEKSYLTKNEAVQLKKFIDKRTGITDHDDTLKEQTIEITLSKSQGKRGEAHISLTFEPGLMTKYSTTDLHPACKALAERMISDGVLVR